MKKISVIIPCYNAEKYISTCMSSLENQSIGMEFLEIIYVNDASTDHTYEILCECEKKYPDSVCVINCEKNGKQGTARNIGIGYSSGEYIGFMDIDDILEPEMFEKLYQISQDFPYDLIICRSKSHNFENLESISMGRTAANDKKFSIRSIQQRETFLGLDINVAVWNKIYKRELITGNNIRFPEGYIYEDIFFSELIKLYATDVYVLEEALYHHIIWPDSTSNDSSDWKLKIDWLFVEELKVLELKRRDKFQLFQSHYEDEFFISYITLITALIINYGTISKEVLVFLQERVLKLFPQYESINIVRVIMGANGSDYKKIILKGLCTEVDASFLNTLIGAVQKYHFE